MAIRQQSLERVASLCRNNLLGKILSGASYGATAYIYQGSSVSDMELNSPQCLLLALLHSLVTEEIMSSCLIADVCHQLQQLQSDYLSVWLTKDFEFPCQDMEKAMALLTKLLGTGVLKLPSHVMRIMSSLMAKYRIHGTHPIQSSSMDGRVDLASRLGVVNNSPGNITTVTEGGDVNILAQSGDSPIHLASRVGSCSSIAALGTLNSTNATPLEEAVKNNCVSSVKALLAGGAKVDKRFFGGDTYLHIAAAGGRNGALEALIKEGMDVNTKNYLSETPLFQAIRASNIRGVEMLLGKGADAGIHPEGGKGILELSLESQNVEILKALLRGEPNIKSKDGDSVYHLIARFGTSLHITSDPSVLNSLIGMGVDVDSRTGNGETALYLAAANGPLDLVRTLCLDGAAVDTQDNGGTSALMVALKNLKEDIATYLLHNGADPNIQDKEGKTALHFAAEGGCSGAMAKGSLELVRTLCQEGAAVDTQDNGGTSALMVALKNLKEDIATYLLHKGADPNIKDKEGRTALHFAVEGGCTGVVAKESLDMVRTLCQEGATVDTQDNVGTSALMVALKNLKEDVATYLLYNGADPNIKDKEGRTALHYAAEGGCTGAVRTLVAAGARVNDQDNKGDTPAIVAAVNNKSAVLRLLVENGTDLALKDRNGYGILHRAAQSGHVEVMRILLDAGVAVYMKAGLYQKTALHFAADEGHTAVVEMLVDHGVDINVRASCGWTALRWANYYNRTAVAEYLRSKGGR